MTITALPTGLYAEVLSFYGHQMQKLDGRDFAGYAATFTEDGEFRHSPTLPAAHTRAGIRAVLEDFHRKFDARRIRRRHWFNQVALSQAPDGSVTATSYCLVLTVHAGVKEPEFGPSCVVHDVLVRGEDGELLLRSRHVTHDHVRPDEGE
ncbi:nuclear transport factor 2 family protein [Streptomyces sp. NPDC003374]